MDRADRIIKQFPVRAKKYLSAIASMSVEDGDTYGGNAPCGVLNCRVSPAKRWFKSIAVCESHYRELLRNH